MKHRLRTIISLATLLFVALQLGVSTPVLAACPASNTSKGQVLQGIGQTGGDCSGSGVTTIVSSVVTIMSIIVGIAAVIMIIIAGFKFVSSGGDAGNVKSARETLIYALIGIVIAILAQFMVHFVINTSQHAAGSGYQTTPVVLRANA